jgi:hypothetical protein
MAEVGRTSIRKSRNKLDRTRSAIATQIVISLILALVLANSWAHADAWQPLPGHVQAPIWPGAAVVVFPGGGYRILAMAGEGTEICDWLASRGMYARGGHAFGLRKSNLPIAQWPRLVGMDLTRLGGHLSVYEEGVNHGEQTESLYNRISAANGGFGSNRAQAWGVVAGVRTDTLDDPQMESASRPR